MNWAHVTHALRKQEMHLKLLWLENLIRSDNMDRCEDSNEMDLWAEGCENLNLIFSGQVTMANFCYTLRVQNRHEFLNEL
jgi:hypothetical protein